MKQKIFTSLMLFAFVLFLFNSCEERIKTDELKPVDVEFMLNNPTETDPDASATLMATVATDNDVQLKSGNLKDGVVNGVPICSNGTPTQVHIVGTGPEGAFDETLDLISTFEDGKQTVLIKIVPGDYTITQFEVLDSDGNNLWVSPLAGSTYADLFNFENSMDLNFTVEEFTKNKIDVDVLCWRDFAYEQFGYYWLDFHNYEIHTLCFFGDVCTKFYDAWSTTQGSAYANVDIQGYDFPALFSVTIVNDADNTQVTTATNSGYLNAQGEVSYGGPVCVEYLDNLEIADEEYTATLNLILPDGSTVVLDEIHFTDADYSDNGTSMDDVSNWGGDDGIWEFAVGSCAMSAQQSDINGVYNIPWMPLPTEMTFKLISEQPASYFSFANIQPDLEVGEFVTGDTLKAWCGNEDWSIHWNHTYKAHVYPYYNIPSTAPQRYQDITAAQWAELNWIANEVINNPATTYNYMSIQNVIWHILGYNGNSSGVSTEIATLEADAQSHISYVPPLGGYVIVLIDPYQDVTSSAKCTGTYQLGLVRFDP